MAVTGCNYGVHPFEHQRAPAHMPAAHMHVCPACDALYLAAGADPCYACAPAGKATV